MMLSDSHEEVRDTVAQLYGVVVGFRGELTPIAQELSLMSSHLAKDTKNLERLHGLILAVGYSVERAAVALGDELNTIMYKANVHVLGRLKITTTYMLSIYLQC